MSYKKQNFKDGNVLKASQLNVIEDQIEQNTRDIKTTVKTVNGTIPDESGNVEVKTGGDTATDDETLDMLIELDMLPAVTSEGAFLTDENGNILMM